MAKHEFGILPHTPGLERYDSYEPEKYHLVSLEDSYIENLLEDFDDIPCYWHTLCRPKKNLAYCGITLIPPASLPRFVAVFRRYDSRQYQQLIDLFEQAAAHHHYIIHFGL